jgi:hypothetical protein
MNRTDCIRGVGACAAITISILGVIGIIHGAPSVPPAITIFDVPAAGQGFGQGTTPQSINAAGDIAGFFADSNDALHGFVRRKDGSIATFDVPGASAKAGEGTMPQGINLSGDIAGYYFTGSSADSVRHGFLRHAAGSFDSFDPPGSISTVAQSLNDSGEIVGNYVRDDVAHGFLREKDGNFVTVDPPGSANTAPLSISAAGEITGYYADDNEALHGFLRRKDGSIIEFDAPGASTNRGQGTFPLAINAQGMIAGYFYAGPSGVLHGFLRGSDGTFTVFDPPGSAGESAHASADREGYVVRPVTAPLSVNTSGDIAGYFGDAAGVLHAFIRSSRGSFSVFEAANASTNGGLGSFAQSMNDRGEVAGYYFDQAHSTRHGFLLKPPQSPVNPPRASPGKTK